MPSIMVTYDDDTTTTVTSASISINATAGGDYQHSSKNVKSLAFTLSTSSTATIAVTSPSSMPAQTCFTGVAPSAAAPFDATWSMSSSSTASLVLQIPATSSAVYRARLAITNGEKVDITVAH